MMKIRLPSHPVSWTCGAVPGWFAGAVIATVLLSACTFPDYRIEAAENDAMVDEPDSSSGSQDVRAGEPSPADVVEPDTAPSRPDAPEPADVAQDQHGEEPAVEPRFTDLVFYEVYPGGLSSGAIYPQDYVVLFNRGPVPIDLSKYMVQYAAAKAAFAADANSTHRLPVGAGMLAPGQYFRLGMKTGGFALLESDDSCGISLSMKDGKLALVLTSAPLFSCGQAPGSPETACDLTKVADFIGWGPASQCAGDCAAAPNAQQVLRRTPVSKCDRNKTPGQRANNKMDFLPVKINDATSEQPFNRKTLATPCPP